MNSTFLLPRKSCNYALPRLFHDMEVTILLREDMLNMKSCCKKLPCDIQCQPETVAKVAVYRLIGILPVESMLYQEMLAPFSKICRLSKDDPHTRSPADTVNTKCQHKPKRRNGSHVSYACILLEICKSAQYSTPIWDIHNSKNKSIHSSISIFRLRYCPYLILFAEPPTPPPPPTHPPTPLHHPPHPTTPPPYTAPTPTPHPYTAPTPTPTPIHLCFCGSAPAMPQLLTSVFTHSDHVFLGLPKFIVPGIRKFVKDLIQDIACCTWPYHLSRWLWNIDVISWKFL